MAIFLGFQSTYAQEDTKDAATRCFVSFQELEYVDMDKAKMYADSAMIYALRSKDNSFIARAHQFNGWHYEDVSLFKKARESYYNSLKFYQKSGDEQGIADAYGNIGNAYLDMNLFQKSLEYQLKSMTANEKILLKVKDEDGLNRAKQGKTYALHNIAAIYTDIELYDRALVYEIESLNAEVIAGNHKGEAISCNAVAISYKNLGKVDSATIYFERAISIYDTLENVQGLASTYFSYAMMEGSSLSAFEKNMMVTASLRMHLEGGDLDSYTHQLLTIGKEHFSQISNDSISSILKTTGDNIRDHDLTHHRLKFYYLESIYYERVGEYKKALKASKEYVELKEVFDIEKRSREIVVGSVKRDMEMKAYNDSLVQSEHYAMLSAVDQKKIADQRSWIVLGVLGGLILIISLFFMVNSNRRKRKMNEVLSGKNEAIEEKNAIVEEHNRSVAASIQYAKRLQTAILPTRKEVNQYLPNSFLLFIPKDVVSGDFYWFGVANDAVYIAAADCTGHGVPGAMVSVVCSNALNRVLNEFTITEPGEILTKTRELVLDTFARSDKKVEDGMDITLCAIDQKNGFIDYAGANNPLWIVRSNALLDGHHADRVVEGVESSLLEFKANKQPVGLYPDMKDFSTTRIPIQKDDQLYLFSDGYADQFGGEHGKKFKSGALKQEILQNSTLNMSEQESHLFQAFKDWMGDQDQVDDVCVIGIQL